MSKLTTEKIAEIRNALTIISLSAETTNSDNAVYKVETIREQVKRIDRLLPRIKFEGGK